MSFTRPQNARSPQVPSLPTGTQIAVYTTYAEAQQAVHYLSAERFPVEHLTIFGTDLHSVERVTGRLSYGRVAIAGAMSGAWFGLFVGLLLSLFGGVGVTTGITFIAVALGAGFGLLFSVLSYAVTRSRRDFTSSSQIVAGQYALLCAPEDAQTAQQLLQRSALGIRSQGAAVGSGGIVGGSSVGTPVSGESTTSVVPVAVITTEAQTAVAATNSGAPAEPWKPDPRWVDEQGRPKYGAMADDQPVVTLQNGEVGQHSPVESAGDVEQHIIIEQTTVIEPTGHLEATSGSQGAPPPNGNVGTPTNPYAPPPGAYRR